MGGRQTYASYAPFMTWLTHSSHDALEIEREEMDLGIFNNSNASVSTWASPPWEDWLTLPVSREEQEDGLNHLFAISVEWAFKLYPLRTTGIPLTVAANGSAKKQYEES